MAYSRQHLLSPHLHGNLEILNAHRKPTQLLRYITPPFLAVTDWGTCAGVKIQGLCVMLPHTADQGKTVRRKLYGDALAKKVQLYSTLRCALFFIDSAQQYKATNSAFCPICTVQYPEIPSLGPWLKRNTK